MEKAAIKDLMYGGINELINNRRFYYKSSIKGYDHWTDEGKEALDTFIKDITMYMREAEDAALDQRAKDIVMKELKS
jgi:hypothetical protein